jgi:actin-related protein 6
MTKSSARKAADRGSSSSNRYACIDNGASAVRVWLSDDDELDVTDPHLSADAAATPSSSLSTVQSAPNFIARSRIQKKTYVAQEISEDLTEYGSLQLKSPIERGYVVDWATQKVIWDRIMHSFLGRADLSGKGVAAGKQRALEGRHVIITEPYFNFPDLQDACDTLLFEEYGAEAIWRTTAAELAHFHPLQQPSDPVIDASFQDMAHSMPSHRPECRLVLDCGHSFCHAVPIVKDRVVWKGVRR